MTDTNPRYRESESVQLKPWYRYPWPWVAIAIPGVAVVGGLFTLYLALSNPDPLVVDDQQYQELRSELLAEPDAEPAAPGPARDDVDGDH